MGDPVAWLYIRYVCVCARTRSCLSTNAVKERPYFIKAYKQVSREGCRARNEGEWRGES